MMQKSTTIGSVGISASVTKLFELFGDKKLSEFFIAVKDMPINDLGIALIGLAFSCYAIYYKEENE